MKKLILIIFILSILLIANIIINNKDSTQNKNLPILSEAIHLENNLSSITISKQENKIELVKEESCYMIKSINFCADDKKIKLLKKLLATKIKDTYKNNSTNISKLGFGNIEENSSVILNNSKTLIFGKLNQYNEIYIQQSNMIYKVDYYEDILETSTKLWIDKSKPLLNLRETDEFHIKIYKKFNEKKTCNNVSHKNLISDINFSNLRNTFFDLYADDVGIIPTDEDNFWPTLIDTVEGDNEMLYSIHIEDAHKKNRIGSKEFNAMLYDLTVWKYKHKAYLLFATGNQWFSIPNSVYENIKSYCKK